MRLIRSRTGTVAATAAGLVTPLLLASGLAAVAPAGATGPGAAGHRAVTSRAAAAGRGPARPVPRNFDVSARPGDEAENTIAVNPADPRNVAAMTCAVGRHGGLFLGVSFNGGRTWRRRLFATGAQVGHTCDEALAWDRYGNLWMSHITKMSPVTKNFDVFVGVSTDGGRHFGKVTDIVPTGPFPTGNAPDQPFITTGPGSVWVSYASVPSGVIQAAGAKVTGRGRFGRFSAPQSVPTRAGHGDASGLAVGPRGQVLVIYENLASAARSAIYTALDPDGLGPAGFGRPRLLARTRSTSATTSSRPSRTGASTPSPNWPGTPAPAATTAASTRSGPRPRNGTAMT
jgi:hypothetical protein